MCIARRPGFTLVELLVVISIVLILTSMLFPTLTKVRMTAHRVTCVNNLRQLSAAIQMYADDHDEKFPNNNNAFLWMGRQWRPLLDTYVGSRASYWCPLDATAKMKYDSTSYAYLQSFYHRPEDIIPANRMGYRTCKAAPATQNLGAVAYPDKKILLYEWTTNHEAPLRTMWDQTGAHVAVFVDGHTAIIRQESLRRSVLGDFDPNWTVGGIGGQDVD